jgi:hypothetical protein
MRLRDAAPFSSNKQTPGLVHLRLFRHPGNHRTRMVTRLGSREVWAHSKCTSTSFLRDFLTVATLIAKLAARRVDAIGSWQHPGSDGRGHVTVAEKFQTGFGPSLLRIMNVRTPLIGLASALVLCQVNCIGEDRRRQHRLVATVVGALASRGDRDHPSVMSTPFLAMSSHRKDDHGIGRMAR